MRNNNIHSRVNMLGHSAEEAGCCFHTIHGTTNHYDSHTPSVKGSTQLHPSTCGSTAASAFLHRPQLRLLTPNPTREHGSSSCSTHQGAAAARAVLRHASKRLCLHKQQAAQVTLRCPVCHTGLYTTDPARSHTA